jgi:hypothetical protein
MNIPPTKAELVELRKLRQRMAKAIWNKQVELSVDEHEFGLIVTFEEIQLAKTGTGPLTAFYFGLMLKPIQNTSH